MLEYVMALFGYVALALMVYDWLEERRRTKQLLAAGGYSPLGNPMRGRGDEET